MKAGFALAQALQLPSEAFEVVLSPKPRMVRGTQSGLSKCLVCEQITAPAAQLAGHVAPRLRISFPQA